MFRIADGREQFYQWDLDRQIIVDDPSIVEVHFCNRTDECSLVTEVVNGRANVPNILLQSSFDIRVFGYDGRATLHDKKFKVNARTRPTDYVYTETEILSVKQLEEELRNEIDERLENIADEIVESLDLSDYYTKEEADEAIYSSKDAYYLEFDTNTSLTEAQPATATMIEYATRFLADQNVCAHVKLVGPGLYVHGYQPVTTEKIRNKIRLTTNAINPSNIANGSRTTYYVFTIEEDSEAGWVYSKVGAYGFTIATKEYVDEAITNIDIPEAEVDLSNYYTKDETDLRIEEAIEGIEIPEPVVENKTKVIRLHTEAEKYTPELVAELWQYINEYKDNGGQVPETTVFYIQCGTSQNCWVLAARVLATVSAYGNYLNVSGLDITENTATSLFIYFNNDGSLQRIQKTYADIVPDASTYYTKDEIDALFEGIATAEGGAY